jgi:hypothetical protein
MLQNWLAYSFLRVSLYSGLRIWPKPKHTFDLYESQTMEADQERTRNKATDKEYERLKLWLDFWIKSIALISAFGTILGTVLGFFINQRIQNVKEQESFERFLVYAVEGNAYDRMKLSKLYASLLSNEKWRDRWNEYYEFTSAQLDEYYEKMRKLNQIQAELSQPNLSDVRKQELSNEEKDITEDIETLRRLTDAVEVVRTQQAKSTPDNESSISDIDISIESELPPNLRSYLIGIYYLSSNSQASSTAEKLETLLDEKGLQISLYPRDIGFFGTKPLGNEVRFDPRSETEAAQQLAFVINSDDESLDVKTRAVITATPNFLSIMIGEGLVE